LTAKVDAAAAQADKNPKAAANILNALKNEINSQSGRQIGVTDAQGVLSIVDVILARLM
jgi:hypothetical protein